MNITGFKVNIEILKKEMILWWELFRLYQESSCTLILTPKESDSRD